MEPELHPVSVTIYEGDVDPTGHYHGRGRAAFKSGAVYEGQWRNGRMHGRGRITFPDGLLYEGDFHQNTISGGGVYVWPGGATYEGQVRNGKRQGQGTMHFADSPTVYEGEWHDGLRHGDGIIYFNEERTTYFKGQWQADQKHGEGVMQYSNGDYYEGQWQADLKHGSGTMHWRSIQQQYSGEWRRNMPNGIGTHVWFQLVPAAELPTHAMLLMYNRYVGHFQDGKRHGYGMLYYATGGRYEGEWQQDAKHGEGCFVFENGEVWHGAFSNDRPLVQTNGSQPPRSNVSGGSGVAAGGWPASAASPPGSPGPRDSGAAANGRRTASGSSSRAAQAAEGVQAVSTPRPTTSSSRPGTSRGIATANGSAAGAGHGDGAGGAGAGAGAGSAVPSAVPGPGPVPESFAPVGTGAALNLEDLLEGEEHPTATRRAVSNVLMCFNTELRALYDKYCKKPSMHLPSSFVRYSFTMTTAQFWELLSDARIVCLRTSLNRIDTMVVRARQAAPLLRMFRQRAMAAAADAIASDATEAAFWEDLSNEAELGGRHNPTLELLFPAFCEAWVRIAAARYSHLPGGLEKRLQALISTHLLHLVSKARGVPPPPPPSPLVTGLATPDATAALESVRPHLVSVFLAAATGQGGGGGGVGQEEAQAAMLWRAEATPRAVLAVLQARGLAGGKRQLPVQAVGTLLCHRYLARYTFGTEVPRLRIEGDGPAGADGMDAVGPPTTQPLERTSSSAPGTSDLRPLSPADMLAGNAAPTAGGAPAAAAAAASADVQEVQFLLDTPMTFPEFVEAMGRVAAAQYADVVDAGIAAQIRAYWAPRPPTPTPPPPEPEPEPEAEPEQQDDALEGGPDAAEDVGSSGGGGGGTPVNGSRGQSRESA